MQTDSEINKAVARKLGWSENPALGWMSPSTQYRKPNAVICQIPGPRDYCHSMDAAWEIMERLEQNIVIDRWERKAEHEQKDWRVMIRTTPYGPQIEAYADTAPMAICLAFLKLSEPTL